MYILKRVFILIVSGISAFIAVSLLIWLCIYLVNLVNSVLPQYIGIPALVFGIATIVGLLSIWIEEFNKKVENGDEDSTNGFKNRDNKVFDKNLIE